MSAHHVTIHAAGVDPAEITINDYHRTTGNDLVAVRIDHNEVVMQGTLAEMEAVVGRLAGLVAEATAARDRDSLTNTQAELVALLDEQQEGQR